MATKVWKDKDGKLFHDACFEEGELREGYDPVDLNNDVDEDDTCESCGGEFLRGPADDADDDDDDTGEDDE